MEAIGLFLLKSAAWLTGFALVYLLVLRNERYFQLNRIFLLSGIVASLLFPFYTFHYMVVIPSLPAVSTSMGELEVGEIVATTPSIPFYYWIYLAGILTFVLRLLFQTWKIIRKLQKFGYELTGDVKVVRTPDYTSSFSFFSFIFVNPSTSAHEMKEIMNHEREHIRQRHWFDLLLAEMICIVQWFNPFAWIYTHLIRQNHEYLADEHALQRTVDPAVYQAALLNQLLGAPVFSLTNSFSYSLNKQRFKMMKKKIDSPFRKLKMLVVLPLAAMLFYAFAEPEYQYAGSDNSVEQQGKTVDVKGQVLKSDGTPLAGTSVILKASHIGTLSDQNGNFLLKGIPADGEIFFSFVGFQTKVQKVSGEPMKVVMEVGKVGIEAVTVVGYGTPPPPPPPPRNLTQALNGSNPPLIILDGVEVDKNKMNQTDPSTIEKMEVLKDQSAIEKYGEKGKNGVIKITTKMETLKMSEVSLYLLDGKETDKSTLTKIEPNNIERMFILKDPTLLASYGEKGKKGVILILTKEYKLNNPEKFKETINKMIKPVQREDGVFVVVEEMPEFPGGEIALRNFIAGAIKYPAEAKSNGIQGKVYVTFVVNSAGKIEKAKIARGVDPLLDAEALRVVQQLPEWKPGRQKGEAVSVSYTVPINFALDGNKPNGQANTPNSVDQQVFVVVEEMPEFPGGGEALRKFVGDNVKYPAEAKSKGIQGKVFVTFVVNRTGKVEKGKIARGVDPLLDAEALRVITLLPDWKPGKQRGEAVDVAYTLPVQFKLDDNKKMETVSFTPPKINEKGEKEVFIVVEEMPEFPGGSVELRNFIAKEVRYPTQAIMDKAQGKVFVSFVVNSEGKIEKAKIERSVTPALDAEALRVVNKMPDWKPGRQRGQAVSVEYTVPIEFKLQ